MKGYSTRNPPPLSLIRCIPPGSSFTGAPLPCKAKSMVYPLAFSAHTPWSAASLWLAWSVKGLRHIQREMKGRQISAKRVASICVCVYIYIIIYIYNHIYIYIDPYICCIYIQRTSHTSPIAFRLVLPSLWTSLDPQRRTPVSTSEFGLEPLNWGYLNVKVIWWFP